MRIKHAHKSMADSEHHQGVLSRNRRNFCFPSRVYASIVVRLGLEVCQQLPLYVVHRALISLNQAID
ncbi:hypothetical protein [Photorhabdus luminescens]|uniref:hypothetical protein n=1 Tax=Photorhabdus luminescens TaxID=29488 RepID=UPI00104C9CDB|nr:hypothetical protein [Photorhabdus luminescens]